ncbi:MAG: hypothetical protein J7605_14055 [Variovorax sp.]|nr:hypothetical protein [Variovorax sp.]
MIAALIAATACNDGHARTVTKLKIEAVGLNRDPPERHSDEECKRFRPTLKQVKNYFNRAYPVEGYMVTTERYSPCYATGTLEFSDGHFGTWRLDSSGTSSFTFNRGDQVFLFYKHNQWFDPTACTYGMGDVGRC